MKKNLLLMLSFITILIASCGKDKTNDDSTAIQGTYKFKFISAKTNSTITGTDGEKMVTLSEYTSTNNAGTIIVDGSNFSGAGLTYEVNSTATGYYYEDNELVDSFSSPYHIIIPAATSTSPYKLIGADSIYFQNGSLAGGIAGNSTMPNQASGGRYTLSGNLLTLKSNFSKDSTFEDSGEMYHQIESALVTIVMEKE